MNRCLLLALLASLGALRSAAQAQVVEYSFAGTINSSGGTLFGLTPQVNDKVIGFLRYNLSAIDDNADPHYARFAQLPPAVYDIYFDGTHFSSDANFFTYVQNDNGGADAFQVGDGETVFDSDGYIRVNGAAQVGSVELSLSTFSSSPFSSDALPATLNLASFTGRQGEVEQGASFATFTINSLTRVPEPSTGALAAIATTFLVGRSPRRSKRCG